MTDAAAALPELAAVPWRPRASAQTLRKRGLIWTAYTVAHVIPFIAAAAVLMALDPISAPVAFAGFATVANHAFAGAPWRLRRRLAPEARAALAAARGAAV